MLVIQTRNTNDKGVIKMNTQNKVFRYLVAGLTVALLAVGATVVYAQVQTPDAAKGDFPIAHRGWGGPHGSGDKGTFLAEALGISVEDLQSAQLAAKEAAVTEAVEAGLLTQEQADMLTERAGFGAFGHKGFGLRGGPESGIDYQALLAEELGISVDDLQAAQQAAQEAGLRQAVEDGLITAEQAELIQAKQALKDYIDKDAIMAEALGISVEDLQESKVAGTRLSDLIEELGLDADEVATQMEAAHQDAIDQAVAAGVITQEQADQIGTLGQFGHGKRGLGMPGFHGRGFRHGPGAGSVQPELDSSLLPAVDV
jgi:hypothetical protein